MTEPVIRDATAADLPAVIALYADDPIGRTREVVSDPPDPAYVAAFEAIRRDPNQRLVVLEEDGEVIATLQLSVLAHLVRRGSTRAQIEAVRVRAGRRGTGAGRRLVEWAVGEARRRDCALVQLTTDAARPEAHRFYERLGFTAGHVGMKLPLRP